MIRRVIRSAVGGQLWVFCPLNVIASSDDILYISRVMMGVPLKLKHL